MIEEGVEVCLLYTWKWESKIVNPPVRTRDNGRESKLMEMRVSVIIGTYSHSSRRSGPPTDVLAYTHLLDQQPSLCTPQRRSPTVGRSCLHRE